MGGAAAPGGMGMSNPWSMAIGTAMGFAGSVLGGHSKRKAERKARKRFMALSDQAIGEYRPYADWGKSYMGQIDQFIQDPSAIEQHPLYKTLNRLSENRVRRGMGRAGLMYSGAHAQGQRQGFMDTFVQAQNQILDPYFKALGVGQWGASNIANIRMDQASFMAGSSRAMGQINSAPWDFLQQLGGDIASMGAYNKGQESFSQSMRS